MTVQRDRRRLAAGNILKVHQLEPIHPTLDKALSCLSYLTFTCVHHRHKEQKKNVCVSHMLMLVHVRLYPSSAPRAFVR